MMNYEKSQAFSGIKKSSKIKVKYYPWLTIMASWVHFKVEVFYEVYGEFSVINTQVKKWITIKLCHGKYVYLYDERISGEKVQPAERLGKYVKQVTYLK